MRLSNKTAVVTGGASGIGRAIARRFAEEGARVVVLDRDAAGAAETCRLIESAGGAASQANADLSKVAEIERAFAQISETTGGVEILVNCAGIFHVVSIEDTDEKAWDSQIDVNLKGAFFCSRAVVARMKERRTGKIINISSGAGLLGMANGAAYCASKGGVVNLTRALACELAPHGINVNCIAPGNVESPMNAHLREGEAGKAWTAKMAELTPTGVGFYKPGDIVGTAVFLASEESDAIQGVTISVDGGWHAW